MDALGLALAVLLMLVGPALIAYDAIATRLERRKPATRRRSPSRVNVDPQYVRDEFARIWKHAPRELRHPDPRLMELYLIPQPKED